MIRRPLRPLARILKARARGENPDAIEAENLRLRREAERDAGRRQAQGRLLLLVIFFALAYGTIGLRMGAIATAEITEPEMRGEAAPILSARADILDRRGRVLATNTETRALYVQMRDMVDPRAAADGLAEIFPDMEAEKLYALFTSGRKFDWLRNSLSAEQMQQVHDLGEPGLLFGPREMRLYPNGQLAAHILGGTRFGEQSVRSAEVLGVAGIEKFFDARLRDPNQADRPLMLSLDLSAQAATEQVLESGVRLLSAKGGAAIIMDVHSGEILSMASYPSFDPNKRPLPLTVGDASDSPLFSRAVQGKYELGSVFKIFAAAQAVELGLAAPDTMIDTKGPLIASGMRVRDHHPMPPQMSVTDIIAKSSNVGAARLALEIGAERQEAFLRALGLGAPLPVEVFEAASIRPTLPDTWRDISSVTVSYGHGISVSPLHLAAAYASLLNGGRQVIPTLERQSGPRLGARVVSEATSAQARAMLREVVLRGTAAGFGKVEGYEIAGKTGTADKATPRGGYYEDKVISSFASVFPASGPRYVLVVMLDEPVEQSGDKPRRVASWTAVPIAAEMVRRVAPILGVRPDEGSYAPMAVGLTER